MKIVASKNEDRTNGNKQTEKNDWETWIQKDEEVC
jgi:hypothetical protein